MFKRKISIVVADDSDELRELLKLGLETQTAFEVVATAADGASAVELAAQLRPDVLVLDLQMPGMNGFEALPLVRRASPSTKVVVLSSFNASHMESIVRDLGAVGYLQKGTTLTGLIDAVFDAFTTGRSSALRIQ